MLQQQSLHQLWPVREAIVKIIPRRMQVEKLAPESLTAATFA